MSAPKVDVLAVLGWYVEVLKRVGGPGQDADIASVRAAVAELIEASRAWCALMPGLAGGPEFDRLRAAAYNIGPQS
jgi:hypothetical protein